MKKFWTHWAQHNWGSGMAYAGAPYDERYAWCRDYMRGSWRRRGSRAWGPWEEWGPWAGFAGGPRGRFFEFGEVRLAILSLLKEEPKHGYQLIKELEERSGGLYRASAGTVYPTLQQLEDEGLISSERQEGRRVYQLTEAGKTELARDPEAVRRIWDRAERWGDWGQWMGPEAFSVFRQSAAMVKATFRAAKWAHGHADREKRLTDLIEKVRRELEELAGQ